MVECITSSDVSMLLPTMSTSPMAITIMIVLMDTWIMAID